MKTCKNCGAIAETSHSFCVNCGSKDFEEIGYEQTVPNIVDTPQNSTDAPRADTMNAAIEQTSGKEQNNGNGNILAGMIGAVIFSLGGGLLYFGLYQLGFIAGISGLVMFLLADLGYGIFAKTNKLNTKLPWIIAIVITAIMIPVAEYFSVAFSVFREVGDYGFSFGDVIKSMPNLLSEPDVKTALISDLVFSYVFTAMATVGTVIKRSKERKKQP